MRLEPILREHADIRVERPPELWEADTDDAHLRALLEGMVAAALERGALAASLTLNVSNMVVEQAEDGEEMVAPAPGEYVGITIRGPADLGPDDTWHTSASRGDGLLSDLHDRLDAAGAKFAYVRRIPPEGSLTVLVRRLCVA